MGEEELEGTGDADETCIVVESETLKILISERMHVLFQGVLKFAGSTLLVFVGTFKSVSLYLLHNQTFLNLKKDPDIKF